MVSMTGTGGRADPTGTHWEKDVAAGYDTREDRASRRQLSADRRTHKQFEYSHKRENHGPVDTLHPPVDGYEVRSEYGYSDEDTEGKDEGEPEAFEDPWNLYEEVGPFDFFLCGSPSDVVRKQMSEQGHRKMYRHSTEEEEAKSGYWSVISYLVVACGTHKNGTQVRFSMREEKMDL